MLTYRCDRAIDACILKDKMSMQEFCEINIYLSKLVSPIDGRMDFSITPWTKTQLEHAQRAHVESIADMASTQTAKTTFQFCVIAYYLTKDPCVMQLTIPSDKAVPNFLTTKLNPFLRSVKPLQKLLKQYAGDENFRTKDGVKQVPDGILFIVGNTKQNRATNSPQRIFIDEVSLFEPQDIVELIGRTKFSEKIGRKIFLTSSRRYRGDAMELAYNKASCKFQLQIECGECGESFYPTSNHLKYLNENDFKSKYELQNINDIEDKVKYASEAAKSAHLLCSCGFKMDDSYIEKCVREEKVYLKKVSGNESDIHYGYKRNALNTGLTSLGTIVKLLIEAGDDDAMLFNIYTDYFNEIYEPKVGVSREDGVLLLGNSLGRFIVPDTTVAVYVTVDTQMDHFWVEVKAFTIDEDGSLNRHAIHASRVEHFKDLVDLKEKAYYYEDGDRYTEGVKRLFIDTQGYYEIENKFDENTGKVERDVIVDRPQEVRDFVYEAMQSWGTNGEYEEVIACVGKESLTNGDAYRFTNTNVTISSYKEERKMKILHVNTTAMKMRVLGALTRTIEKRNLEVEGIDNSIKNLFLVNQDLIDSLKEAETLSHTAYNHQLTSTVWGYDRDGKGGRKKKKSFFKIKKHDHFVDTSVLAEVAAIMDNVKDLTPRKSKKGQISSDVSSVFSDMVI